MKNIQRFLHGLALAALLVFVLSGCVPIIKASSELKMSYQEKWDFSLKLVVSPAISTMLAGALQEEFAKNDKINQAGVQVKINQLAAEPDGNIPVQITMNGPNYEAFRAAFGAASLLVEEKNGIRTLTFNLSALANQTGAQSTEFTLRGGKILDQTGGTLLDANTVQWVNYPDVIHVKMEEPTFIDSNLPVIIIGGICVFLALGMIVLVLIVMLTRKKPAPQRTYTQPAPSMPQPPQAYPPTVRQTAEPAQPQRKHCTQCGGQIPIHATFCPMCGAKQP